MKCDTNEDSSNDYSAGAELWIATPLLAQCLAMTEVGLDLCGACGLLKKLRLRLACHALPCGKSCNDKGESIKSKTSCRSKNTQ